MLGALSKVGKAGQAAKKAPIKASEALGKHEGKTLMITEADRTKVGQGFLGGPGFSSLQLDNPAYRDPGAVWGVAKPSRAATLVESNKRLPEGKVIWSTFLGKPEQHKSNQMVFDKLLKEFRAASKEGKLDDELKDKINRRLAIAADKDGNLLFPSDVDITSPKFKKLANTFDRRAAAAEIMGGEGVGGKKGQIFDYQKVIQSTTDPDLLEAKTGSIGNRLFTMSNEVIDRPDLHPAFPSILTGEDLGVNFSPVLRDLVMRDYIKNTMETKGRLPGQWDWTRGYAPQQFIDEALLTEMQKQGYKGGGKVDHKLKAWHEKNMAKGGEVKMQEGGDPVQEMFTGTPPSDMELGPMGQAVRSAGSQFVENIREAVQEPAAFHKRALGNIAKRLEEDPEGFVMDWTGGGVGGVIKPKGGQWWTGKIEEHTGPLRTRLPWTESQLAEMPQVAKAHEADLAVNKFVQGPLTKYIKNEMATAHDPLRKMADENYKKAEQQYEAGKKRVQREYDRLEEMKAEGPRPGRPAGTFENALEQQKGRADRMAEEVEEQFERMKRNALPFDRNPPIGWVEEQAKEIRTKAGYPAEGMATTEAGKAWEIFTDRFIQGTPAREMLQPNYFLDPSYARKFLAENPWITKVDPDTPIYRTNAGFTTGDTGFKHLVDELKNAMNPESGLPQHLRLTPEQVASMGMEKATRHVIDINLWRAEQKVAEDALRAQKAAVVYKEYPESEKGLRWVELKMPEKVDLPEGYSVVPDPTRDVNGNIIQNGYRLVSPNGEMINYGLTQEDAIKGYFGRKELEDALKYEGEVMRHCVGGYCPDVESGASRIFSLRDSRGKPHATIEVKPSAALVRWDEVYKYLPQAREQVIRDRLDRGLNISNEEEIDKIASVLAAYLAQKNQPAIIQQIKGVENQKPKDEYIPYIQDFVKSQNWYQVRDFSHTDLIDLRNTSQVLDILGTRDVGKAKELQEKVGGNYITKQELEAIKKEMSKAAGGEIRMANGGSVDHALKAWHAAQGGLTPDAYQLQQARQGQKSADIQAYKQGKLGADDLVKYFPGLNAEMVEAQLRPPEQYMADGGDVEELEGKSLEDLIQESSQGQSNKEWEEEASVRAMNRALDDAISKYRKGLVGEEILMPFFPGYSEFDISQMFGVTDESSQIPRASFGASPYSSFLTPGGLDALEQEIGRIERDIRRSPEMSRGYKLASGGEIRMQGGGSMDDYAEQMIFGTPAQDQKPAGEAFRDVGRDLVRGAQYLPYDILGAPVDIATMVMRPFGYGTEKPIGGSDWLIEKAVKAGIADEPTNSAAELASRIGLGLATPVASKIGKIPELKVETAASKTKAAEKAAPIEKGVNYETVQEGPFLRVKPEAARQAGSKDRGIREGIGQAETSGGPTGGDVSQRVPQADVSAVLNDPNNFVRQAANQYSQKYLGQEYALPEMPPSSLAKQSAIGRTFQLAAEDDPQYKKTVFEAYGKAFPQLIEQSGAKNYDQLLEAAYKQLAKETKQQFESLPVNMSFHRAGEGDYANSNQMLQDVFNNRHLYVYQGGKPHDFLNEVDPRTGLNTNEMFRAVHDFYGHAVHGNPFGPKGEEIAYGAHAGMFSPLARMAMAAETRGQNSFVNYSPLNAELKAKINQLSGLRWEAQRRGQSGMLADIDKDLKEAWTKFQFAPQKSLLLPPEFLDTGYRGGMPNYLQSLVKPQPGTTTSEFLTHYSQSPSLSMLHPSRYGTGIKGEEARRLEFTANPVRERTYFYTGDPSQVRPEPGLGPYRYGAMGEDLYDITADPARLGLIAAEANRIPFTSLANKGLTDPAQVTTDLERMVKEYGYAGLINPERGVGLKFTPTPVKRFAKGGLAQIKK